MYTRFDNLTDLIKDIAPDSITSRTIYKDAQIKAVLFGFAEGQSLSEHSAGQPAIIHVLQGEATITLGGEAFPAQPGAWIHMPARLPHSVLAHTPLMLLLLLIQDGGE